MEGYRRDRNTIADSRSRVKICQAGSRSWARGRVIKANSADALTALLVVAQAFCVVTSANFSASSFTADSSSLPASTVR